MSFATAAAAAQAFSLENDTSNFIVLDDNYISDSEPRDQPPIDFNLLSPLLSRAESDYFLHHGHADHTNGSASRLQQFELDRLVDFEGVPLFDANFSNQGDGSSEFPSSQSAWDSSTQSMALMTTQHDVFEAAAYPLTPEQTASIFGLTPRSGQRAASLARPDSISPLRSGEPFAPALAVMATPRAGPNLNDSGRSSEDGLAPAPLYTMSRSPRVTVSVWETDHTGASQTIERSPGGGHASEIRPSKSTGDLRSSLARLPASTRCLPQHRDSSGNWQRDPITGLGGLDPRRRQGGDVESINEIARQHMRNERNHQVGEWVVQNTDIVTRVPERSTDEMLAIEEQNRGAEDSIPIGSGTENRYVSGQTYYHHGNEAQLTKEDYDIILKNRNWADAPLLHKIQDGVPGRNQPQSSQAAIEKFEKMCRDNDSVISRAATWGTRRRSLPSVADVDIEGITSGKFLKKLSISRNNGGGSKSGNLLKDLRGLVRRPSAATIRKRSRSRSGQTDAPSGLQQQQQEERQQEQRQPEEALPGKRESITHLSPISRTTSWGRKATPSINEALITMGQNFASIGGGRHSRSGSVSNLPSNTAPLKGSLSGLGVRNSLRRQRSKSDLSKPSGNSGETHSNLADLWWRSGGPPVAPMVSRAQVEPDDEEDEDDESFEDNDMKMNSNLIDDITPNIAGFQMHVKALNPGLRGQDCMYLVERIAQHQVVRYKQLLTSRVKHLGLGLNCPSGPLCLALNGSAVLPDSKRDARDPEPLSTGFDDGDVSGVDGAINQDSFPADIPMPPTSHLPADFECQLCFQHKRPVKPSDWTKHVHEDVQPFTCTWKGCRDPKMFKRKADWVRHENEGHRHLEWWSCDVDDCRHVCYRRDNFLQHLVREHKFVEPKVKNKAALKKVISIDPTWRKVEQCHKETTNQPQDEPCKFCGKVFPTWKKLTVHLAKHMEQIALPILRLVEAKAQDLDANTVISPVQDRAPRQSFQCSGELAPFAAAAAAAAAPSFDAPGHCITSQLQRSVPYDKRQTMMGHTLAPQPWSEAPSAYHPTPHSGQFQPQFYSQQMIRNLGGDVQFQTSRDLLEQPGHGVSSDMQLGCAPSFLQAGGIDTHTFVTGIPDQSLLADGFPAMNGLGLQNAVMPSAGGQFMYDGTMEASSGNVSPFSGKEGLSPYSRSPHPQAGVWDDVRYTGL